MAIQRGRVHIFETDCETELRLTEKCVSVRIPQNMSFASFDSVQTAGPNIFIYYILKN